MSRFPRCHTLSLVLWVLLLIAGAARAAPPEQSAAAVPAPLTPQQAERAISVLEDDQKRAELLQTLRAIAQAAPAAAAASSDAAPPAAGGEAAPAADHPAPASAATPAPAAGASAISLTSGGLVAQLITASSARFANLSDELLQTAR